MHTDALAGAPSIVRRSLDLQTPTGFSFAHTLSFLASFPATRGEQEIRRGALTKCFSADGRAVLVSLSETHEGLRLEVRSSAPIGEASMTRLVAHRRYARARRRAR